MWVGTVVRCMMEEEAAAVSDVAAVVVVVLEVDEMGLEEAAEDEVTVHGVIEEVDSSNEGGIHPVNAEVQTFDSLTIIVRKTREKFRV